MHTIYNIQNNQIKKTENASSSIIIQTSTIIDSDPVITGNKAFPIRFNGGNSRHKNNKHRNPL